MIHHDQSLLHDETEMEDPLKPNIGTSMLENSFNANNVVQESQLDIPNDLDGFKEASIDLGNNFHDMSQRKGGFQIGDDFI